MYSILHYFKIDIVFRVLIKDTFRSKDFTPSTSRDCATNPLPAFKGRNAVYLGNVSWSPFLSRDLTESCLLQTFILSLKQLPCSCRLFPYIRCVFFQQPVFENSDFISKKMENKTVFFYRCNFCCCLLSLLLSYCNCRDANVRQLGLTYPSVL